MYVYSVDENLKKKRVFERERKREKDHTNVPQAPLVAAYLCVTDENS